MEAGTSVKSIYARTLNITILAQTKTHKIRPLYPGPYERHPHDIHAWRSPAFPHPGSPAPALYMAWSQELAGTGRDASHLHVFPGCGGVLYPLRALHSDAVLRERFMDLAPTADALWLWCMATVRGTRVRIVAERGPYIIPGRGDVRGNMPPLLASRTGRSGGDRTTRNWRRSSSSVLFRGAHPILRETKKAPQKRGLKNALALFYFPTQIYAVSSTMEGLTAEFGMGSGVPPPP